MGEKCPIKFSQTIVTSTVIVGFFYMPQSCDMGPTALLPLRNKACWRFFRPKNPTASAGFEPANMGTQGLSRSTAYLEPVVQTDPPDRTVWEVVAQSGATSTETDTNLATAE
jgi:hypothetical protein